MPQIDFYAPLLLSVRGALGVPMRALLFLISAFAAGAVLAYPVNALVP
jgi:hypothetical protein